MPVDCVGEMQKFIDAPLSGVNLLREHALCNAESEEVFLHFPVPAADQILENCNLTGFLVDFTYQTNRDGLLA